MIELTTENVLDYLRQHGRIGDVYAEAEQLSGGVSNQVLRITLPDRCFVIKQSRPQLRTRDAWFSDLERIHREQEVMQALFPWLPKVVPAVHFVDRSNYIYAMSHAPRAAIVWKTELLQGKIDCALGSYIGQVLGRIHQVSAEQTGTFEAFRDHRVFVQLRVDPFYRRIQERRPEVAAIIEATIQEMLTLKVALCHGDFTPKNMLVHEGGFTLVDYETAHLGDPAMDLGLFLTHLMLKAIHAPERGDAFLALMRSFWNGYCAEIHSLSIENLERRALPHLGICLLARVDGTSPVEYLTADSKCELVRRMGRSILLDRFERWEQAWQWYEQETNSKVK